MCDTQQTGTTEYPLRASRSYDVFVENPSMKPYFIECPYPEITRSGLPHKNNLVNLNQVAMIGKIQHSHFGIGFANESGEYFHQWLYNSEQQRDDDYSRLMGFLP